MWPERITDCSYNGEDPQTADPTCGSAAPAPPQRRPGARGRDFTANITPIPEALKARRGGVPCESDDLPGRPPIRHRSPWNEDLPSPRCVLHDAVEAARMCCSWMPVLYVPYWLFIGGPPLVINMLAASLHIPSQRAPYFWTAAGVAGILWLIIEFAH